MSHKNVSFFNSLVILWFVRRYGAEALPCIERPWGSIPSRIRNVKLSLGLELRTMVGPNHNRYFPLQIHLRWIPNLSTVYLLWRIPLIEIRPLDGDVKPEVIFDKTTLLRPSSSQFHHSYIKPRYNTQTNTSIQYFFFKCINKIDNIPSL